MKKQKNKLSEEEGMEDVEDEEESTYQQVRRISITLPEDIAKEAEKYAKEHKLKRSQVIALALEKGLGDQDRIFKKLNRIESMLKTKMHTSNPSETNPSEEIVFNDEQRKNIDSLLADCTSLFSPFEIQGEDGFLFQVQKRGLTGSSWTDEMLQVLASKLSIGYENWYLNKPEPQTLIDRCSEAMELSEHQKNKLMQYFAECVQGLEYTEAEETTEEEEK